MKYILSLAAVAAFGLSSIAFADGHKDMKGKCAKCECKMDMKHGKKGHKTVKMTKITRKADKKS